MSGQPASPITPAAERRALLTHDRLLGQRIYTHALIRFIVVAAIVIGAVFGRVVVGIEDLDVAGILTVAVYIAAYNIPILLTAAANRNTDSSPEKLATLRILKHTSTLLDYLALTAVVWFLGGIRSPFVAFYLFHLIIASTLLPVRAAIVSTVAAAAMLAGLAFIEITGLLPPRLPAGVVPSTGPLSTTMIATILVVYMLLFGLITALVSSLAAMLRHGEETLLDQADELKQLNAQRRDLLQLTLHNLQSPVAAAGMLLGNLRNGLRGPLEPRQIEQIDRAMIRLDSITGFIQDLGLLSRLESGDLTGQIEPIDICALIDELASEHAERANERHQTLSVETPPKAIALGVPRLVREAIINYLTNAIKYTPEGGSIRISARTCDGRVRVALADDGVGIPLDKQNRVFGEYVRLAPKHPSLGKTEGTGLGLSIVKRSTERQGGSVGFESKPGVGSTFWLELPEAPAGPSPSQV